MDALTSGIKREIVRRVFPDLQYGGDPDVERYFELRASGRMAEALAIYNGRLRVRYPDDAQRITLLGLYRSHDPRYAELQEHLMLEYAEGLARRIRTNIDLIVRPLDGAVLTDALGALKAVESILSRLGGESETALALLERYTEYASVLGHRADSVRCARDLVREYDAVSRSDTPAEYDFVARSEAIEAKRRAAAGDRHPHDASRDDDYDFVARSAANAAHRRELEAQRSRTRYFDPAKIKFTQAERALVEIPSTLKRREDKVLAFCAKYWARARDPGFERMVFLYARKYGTRHYEVLRAVKLGRSRGATDDEVLSAVSAILSSSYDYSVSGDLYMQVMWRRLKSRMEAREVAERLAVPGPESKVRAARERRPEEPAPRDPARSSHPAKRVEPEASEEHAPATKPGRTKKTKKTGVPRTGTSGQTAKKASPPERHASLKPAAKAKGVRLLKRPPSGPQPLPEMRGSGSISDKIRSLSGRAYDVYKEIFLARVREHIHRALLANPSRPHSLFDTAANEAEDQVYGFMTAHYDDPFMDWSRSAERQAVEALGFAMPSLDPVIEACFKKL
jgi:hypothetical protein